MMKLVFLAVLVCAVFAAEKSTGPLIKILRLENNLSPEGQYSYSYETENGISAEEKGQPSGPGEEAGTVAQGSYKFTSPEGQVVAISYVADEGGFQAVGDAIPVPPEIPDAIAKSLVYNAAHPGEESSEKSTLIQSGQYSSAPTGQYSPVGKYALG